MCKWCMAWHGHDRTYTLVWLVWVMCMSVVVHGWAGQDMHIGVVGLGNMRVSGDAWYLWLVVFNNYALGHSTCGAWE